MTGKLLDSLFIHTLLIQSCCGTDSERVICEFSTQPNLGTKTFHNRSQAVDPNWLINIPLLRTSFPVTNLFLVESICFSSRQQACIFLKQLNRTSVRIFCVFINSSSPRLILPVRDPPLIRLTFLIFLIQQKFASFPFLNRDLRVETRGP